MSVFDTLGKAPSGFANVSRWYRHIASFTTQERAAWGGSALPQASGAKGTTPAAAADDDDVDLFGSDEEDEEAEKIKEERLKAYAEKKSKKPALIAKSSILLDVKPWDDETDMKELEKHVRTVVMDGLLWGVSKLVPLAYGINKLQICCVIEGMSEIQLISIKNLMKIFFQTIKSLLMNYKKRSKSSKISFNQLTLLPSTKSKLHPETSTSK